MTVAPSLKDITEVGEPLPEPTRDLDQAQADLDRWGYCRVREALDAQALAAVRGRLIAVAEAERADGVANLRDRDRSQTVGALLNNLIKGPEKPAQIVHADQTYMPESAVSGRAKP